MPSMTKRENKLKRALLRWEKKQQQTPEWADLEAIQQFYANTPKGYNVDHIIPLARGGLHDLPNLQYLTIEENQRKQNLLPCEWTQYRIYKARQEFKKS